MFVLLQSATEFGQKIRVPGLQYNFVHPDSWTCLNVLPAKIMGVYNFWKGLVTAIPTFKKLSTDLNWPIFTLVLYALHGHITLHCYCHHVHEQILLNLIIFNNIFLLILKQQYMFSALQQHTRKILLPADASMVEMTSDYLEACHLIFEKGILSHITISPKYQRVLENIILCHKNTGKKTQN